MLSADQDYADPWTKDLFTPAMKIQDGKINVPQKQGWGISINPSWPEKAVYTCTEL